ncbi:unnamed protein product [Mycena citricolor]|uniref:Uncharacterized protein n=1 Tax=Mycena citricolor TaxID=2018698 RepID=A0AAD2H046_9AGAR|nr:unnamed protein product [Mycena citricolor]
MELRQREAELHQRESEKEIQQLRQRNRELEQQLARSATVNPAQRVYRHGSDDDGYTSLDAESEVSSSSEPIAGSQAPAWQPALHATTTPAASLRPEPSATHLMSSAPTAAVTQSSGPTNASEAQSTALVSLGLPHNQLTDDQKEVRGKITRHVGATFRNLCGITSKNPWPDPDSPPRTDPSTGETLFIPNFPGGLTNRTNTKIVSAVADTILKEFKDPACRPAKYDTCGGTIDRNILQDFAKESFKGFKRQYIAQVDEAARQKRESNNTTDRCTQRRRMKTKQRRSAVPTYAARHNLDPDNVTATVDVEYQSDELSMPNSSDSDTDQVNWAVRMAKASGRKDVTRNSVKGMHFLEVCKPPWQTDQAANMNIELSQIYEHSMAEADKDKRKYVRVCTTTRIDKRVPEKAPYNFAIRPDWLAEQMMDPDSDKAKYLVSTGWGTWSGPPGFDLEPVNASTSTNDDVAINAQDN